jgi:hypothetical protein
MKIDLYTKIVLTVIAISLASSAIKDIVRPAQAQSPMPVNIVSWGAYAAVMPIPVRVSQ